MTATWTETVLPPSPTDPCRKPLRHIGTSVGRHEAEGDSRAAVRHSAIHRPGLHEFNGRNPWPVRWEFLHSYRQPGIRSPAERSPACAVPEKPRSTRFPQAVPRVSCAAMGVRQCAVRGAAVTLTVLELFELFDSAMKVSTSTINVMVCAPGLVGSSRTDCCH